MSRFDRLEEDRDDSLGAWFRWYFHPRKFWLDQGGHVLLGALTVLPVALAGSFPIWAGALAPLPIAVWREIEQWPPREMPVFGRAWFDPILDVLFFAAGGAAAAFVPSVL